MTDVLNKSCIGCLDEVYPTGARAGLILLATLRTGHDADFTYHGLCFAHRRYVDERVKEILRDRKPSSPETLTSV